jgi:hypothetical protein
MVKRSRLSKGAFKSRVSRLKSVSSGASSDLDDVEAKWNIRVAQWFEKGHIEQFLGRSISDDEWRMLKEDDDFWMDIANASSEEVRSRIKQEFVELMKGGG